MTCFQVIILTLSHYQLLITAGFILDSDGCCFGRYYMVYHRAGITFMKDTTQK